MGKNVGRPYGNFGVGRRRRSHLDQRRESRERAQWPATHARWTTTANCLSRGGKENRRAVNGHRAAALCAIEVARSCVNLRVSYSYLLRRSPNVTHFIPH